VQTTFSLHQREVNDALCISSGLAQCRQASARPENGLDKSSERRRRRNRLKTRKQNSRLLFSLTSDVARADAADLDSRRGIALRHGVCFCC